MSHHGLLGVIFTFIYIDDVCTSQQTHLWASMACYGYGFTFCYVNYVRT
jgi:hypothetical protein